MSDGFETLAIHAGQEPDPATGAVVPPIYQVSTFKQDGVGGLRGGYEYSRSANPTRRALEEFLTARGFACERICGAPYHDVPRPLRPLDRWLCHWPSAASILLVQARRS